MEPWASDEQIKLKSLHLDPLRNGRGKLIALTAHFKRGGGIWSVSEGGTGPVTISRGLARKVRNLVLDHELDWLLDEEIEVTGTPGSAITGLRILSPSIGVWTDGVSIAKYATIKVATISGVEARDCWAWVDVLPQGPSLPLHWAGTPYTAEEASSPRTNISPSKAARLDVAVALPPPSEAPSNIEPTQVCGEVPMYVPSSRYGEQTWYGEGCWLAQPLALYNPSPGLESFLLPSKYKINVRVGCDKGEGDNREFILQSPISWEGLELMLSNKKQRDEHS